MRTIDPLFDKMRQGSGFPRHSLSLIIKKIHLEKKKIETGSKHYNNYKYLFLIIIKG